MRTYMPRYSEERKAAILKRLLPPENLSVPLVAGQEGISEATLYNWRTQARERGVPVPGSCKQSDEWSPQAKLAAVMETATLSEAELNEYCRQKGLYPEQIKAWKAACLDGVASGEARQLREQKAGKQTRKRIRQLEKELNRKDKALAETAALLALRKKLSALWDDNEED